MAISSFSFCKFDVRAPHSHTRRRFSAPVHFKRCHLPTLVSTKFFPFSSSNSNARLSISCSGAGPSLIGPAEGSSPSQLLPEAEHQEPEVRTGMWNWRDYQIRYQFAGNKGPALVLIHGFGANSDHWRKNIPILAKSHKVYSIDLIGYGYSDKPKPCDVGVDYFYTFETWATQLNDFCADVVKDEVFFICNSIGGLVGLQAAIMEPQICKGLVLLNISLRMLHITKQPWYGRPFIRSFQNLLRKTDVGKLFFKAVATPKSVRSILCQNKQDNWF